jgi:DNA topoisomerase-1
MRTDSTRISDDALVACASASGPLYGPEYMPEKPNFYKSKKDAPGRARGHPTDPTSTRPGIDQAVPFQGRARALQAHLEASFVASQMKPAVYDEIAVEICRRPYMPPRQGARS